jgi:hypothetical protein
LPGLSRCCITKQDYDSKFPWTVSESAFLPICISKAPTDLHLNN